MFHCLRRTILTSILIFYILPTFGQAQPCQSGSLAGVIDSSCFAGRLILNFLNVFSGQAEVFLPENITTVPISPGGYSFIPVQSGNQAGVKLIGNFTDRPEEPGAIALHEINFAYLTQAAPGSI